MDQTDPEVIAAERTAYRVSEGLLILVRLLARASEPAIMGMALALGRLCFRLTPGRFDQVLGLARKSYEAAR
jgi:hypothetical protein